MRIEFLDLLDRNETLSSGLFTLSHLLEIVENTEEYSSVSGVYELVKIIAYATKKQTKDMKFVFEYTEREGH